MAALALAPPSAADHVTVSPSASARLGDPIGDRSWEVVVDWGITCGQGGPTPSYGGNLYLIDQVTEAETYLGGTFGASGQTIAVVGRAATPRYFFPRIKSWCGTGLPLLHGTPTVEVTGTVVEVPALGVDDADADGHGGQGDGDFPGRDFGNPSDPLRPGGCGQESKGTTGADTLNGTSLGDLIIGLEGNDVIRGRSGDDCLIGDDGNDKLFGNNGSDRLTGGGGGDKLVGGKGLNRYDAGSGNDYIIAVNKRRELVSCGKGRDRARVDRRDQVRSCEQVTRVR